MLKSSFHILLHILTTYADYAIETELCNHPTEIFQCLFAFFSVAVQCRALIREMVESASLRRTVHVVESGLGGRHKTLWLL